MPTSLLFPDSQIAAIALQAKAALPSAVNGRVEKAVRLVQSSSVELHEDGSATVLSESDGLTGYRVQHGQCSCPDFQFQAPDVGGWCCHRIAAALARRLQRQQAEAPIDVTPKALPPGPVPSLGEAPASATVRLTIAGHKDVIFTLRDHDEHRLLGRLEALLQRFPVETPPGLVQSASAPQGKEWCAIHSLTMKLNHGKDGSTWYSHKTAEGFCKGRAKRG